MIRFRNAMGYYDIHTHQMPFHKEDIAIINRIVSPMGDMQPGPLLDTVIRSYGIHPWYIYNVKEQMDLLRYWCLVRESAIGEADLIHWPNLQWICKRGVSGTSQFSGGNT